MKFYLSSFKLGTHSKELVRMMEPAKKIGYVPNACDYTNVNVERRNQVNVSDMAELMSLGLDVQLLDLKDYFEQTDKLRKRIGELAELLKRDDFVYSGYSAGICVLGPDLKVLQTVDDPADKPYERLKDTIWEGLGYLDYMILPHYKSDHPESAAVDKAVEYCQMNGIPFKTLRDGEAIVIE